MIYTSAVFSLLPLCIVSCPHRSQASNSSSLLQLDARTYCFSLSQSRLPLNYVVTPLPISISSMHLLQTRDPGAGSETKLQGSFRGTGEGQDQDGGFRYAGRGSQEGPDQLLRRVLRGKGGCQQSYWHVPINVAAQNMENDQVVFESCMVEANVCLFSYGWLQKT